MSKFEQYVSSILTENKDFPYDSLDQIKNKYKDILELYWIIYPEKNMIQLHTLRAKKTAPKGTGTSFMNDICQWADINKILLVLQTANKDKNKYEDYKSTSSTDRLKKFYGRFGFKSNYSKRRYRPDYPGNMNRPPQ